LISLANIRCSWAIYHTLSLAQILDDAELNPVLHILRVWGPGKLYGLLEAKGLGTRLPRSFIKDNHCHLCYTLLNDAVLRAALAALANDAALYGGRVRKTE